MAYSWECVVASHADDDLQEKHERGLVAALTLVYLPTSRLYGRLGMQPGASEASKVVSGSGVSVPGHCSPPSAVWEHGQMFSAKSVLRAHPLVKRAIEDEDRCIPLPQLGVCLFSLAMPFQEIAQPTGLHLTGSSAAEGTLTPSPLWVPACAGTTIASAKSASGCGLSISTFWHPGNAAQ